MFEHRLGALLGLSIDQVLALPVRELVRWQLYWNEEPWGPYRDNMHAALMIQQLLRPHIGPKGTVPPLAEFMFEHPDDRKQKAGVAFRAKLVAMRDKQRKGR